MATPKPGEIRCPTCHRSTPPAAFCTQCGSSIPTDARARPRGMDRDELQDRIRARRSGGDPYFRGADAEEGTGIYERFEPDPIDAMAQRAPQPTETRRDYLADDAPRSEPNLTRDHDDWSTPPPVPAAPPIAEPDWGGQPASENIAPEAAYAEPVDDEDGYYYDDWQEPERQSRGGSPLAIVGFLALGVLALVAGGVIASLWGGQPVGQSSPSPTTAVSSVPSASASTAPTEVASPSADASSSAGPSDGPIVFPDGFTAEAQPCFPGSAGQNGCDSNGVSNAGSVDIWVGFKKGTASDVIGAFLESDGESISDASIDLARIGCGRACNGYTRFSFANLAPGRYTVRITRNGQPAGSTAFEVS